MTDLQLTILGNGPSCPGVNGASSGYLVTAGSTSLVLDFGTGVVSTPAFRRALPELDGIVISHLHADHWLSLVPLGYLLKVSPDPPRDGLFKVWEPPGAGPGLGTLLDAVSFDFPFDVYDHREYPTEEPLSFPNARVTFREVRHYIPSYAMRVERNGRSLVYSSDTAPCQALADLANGCDLLLAEATHGTALPDPAKERGHLTAKEAGELAAEANVGHLLLTHVWESHDPEELVNAAGAAFSGPISVAEAGRTYDVGDSG